MLYSLTYILNTDGRNWFEMEPPRLEVSYLPKCWNKHVPPCVIWGAMGEAHGWGVMCVVHLRWTVVEPCRTSFQMCRSWYFPIFLLKDGSLTQMYMAFLMVLIMPCASLPTMVKQSTLIGCPIAWLCWKKGDGLWGPSQFPDISLLTFYLDAFVPADYPTLLSTGVLVFGCH